jgi:hypothetical protein
MMSNETFFLEGMYYAGILPSRAESHRIARYLRSNKLAQGTLLEIETRVLEAMAVIHQRRGKLLESETSHSEMNTISDQ